MSFYQPGHVFQSCEVCKYCGGWLVLPYAENRGTYEVFMCGKPGDRRAMHDPNRGCTMWVEAPEIALGFYDLITGEKNPPSREAGGSVTKPDV